MQRFEKYWLKIYVNLFFFLIVIKDKGKGKPEFLLLLLVTLHAKGTFFMDKYDTKKRLDKTDLSGATSEMAKGASGEGILKCCTGVQD